MIAITGMEFLNPGASAEELAGMVADLQLALRERGKGWRGWLCPYPVSQEFFPPGGDGIRGEPGALKRTAGPDNRLKWPLKWF